MTDLIATRTMADAASAGGADLAVEGLVVTFGGLMAVQGLDLHASAGTITGLIGPNGAGKTTTFNACTGAVNPSKGSVSLGGEELSGPPARRAQRGLGRTFQRMELFDTMTVAENVALGPEALIAGRRPWKQLAASRQERADVAEVTVDAIDRCGLGHLATRNAGELSTGERRLVELARAVASRFRFLLLDEPSSGLDIQETEQFGAVLESIISRDGTGILLVEHDMALVRLACRYIYVLDFGALVYEGPTADVLASDVVKAAYLGSDAVEDDL